MPNQGIEPRPGAVTTVGYRPNSEEINWSKLHFIEKMAILQYLRANFLNEKVNLIRGTSTPVKQSVRKALVSVRVACKSGPQGRTGSPEHDYKRLTEFN